MTERITLYQIFGRRALYDLSNGSLSDEALGTYDGIFPIYSAEAFLNDIIEEADTECTVLMKTLPEDKVCWRDD